MREFGGPAILLDRSDINTDEIIPAKYLTESTKKALAPHLLEDLLVDGKPFDHRSDAMRRARVVVARDNFGCGSSREHAVWAFEVNDIDVIIASGFARIFRQNMFNCGILAVELKAEEIDALFAMNGEMTITIDLEKSLLHAETGGWVAYADSKY